MSASFRPLIYTWGAILGGLAGGAGALQIIGPPPQPAQAVLAAVAARPVASAPVAAPQPAEPEVAVASSATPTPPPAAPEPAVTPQAAAPEVAEKPSAPPSPATVPDKRAASDSVAVDAALQASRRTGPERRRSVAFTAPKPLLQEGVSARKPDFIGVYVTQADGTRVFKALP